MESEQQYKSTKKVLNAFFHFFKIFFQEFWNSLLNRGRDIYKLLSSFKKDILSQGWEHGFFAVISVLIILYITAFVPLQNFYEWIEWQRREWNIVYAEMPPKTKNQLNIEIHQFAEDYTKAFGTDCEWFRNRDVDIEMWENHRSLYRNSYTCANFNNTSDIILFPIRISAPKRGDLIETVDVLFGKVEYDQNGATKYTSIESKLWRVLDENFWRIDRMNNVQKHEF